MFKWFKNLNELRIKLLYVAKHYDKLVGRMDELRTSQIRVENNVNEAVQVIRDRTGWHTDVHAYQRNAQHQVILIGVYNRQDYIEVFNVPNDEFRNMVMRCKDVSKFAHRGVVDAIPEMRMILDRETY